MDPVDCIVAVRIRPVWETKDPPGMPHRQPDPVNAENLPVFGTVVTIRWPIARAGWGPDASARSASNEMVGRLTGMIGP